jgi:hypothetical protein
MRPISWTNCGARPPERLVEQQDARKAHQSPPDRDHLLFAAGQRSDRLAAPFGQAWKQLEHPGEPLLHGVEIDAGTFLHAAKLEIFQHRQAAEQVARLRHLHHAVGKGLVRCASRDVGAVEDDAAAHCKEAGDGIDQRALAAAVGAEQRDDFPVVHLQRDPMQDFAVAITGEDVLDAQHSSLYPR